MRKPKSPSPRVAEVIALVREGVADSEIARRLQFRQRNITAALHRWAPEMLSNRTVGAPPSSPLRAAGVKEQIKAFIDERGAAATNRAIREFAKSIGIDATEGQVAGFIAREKIVRPVAGPFDGKWSAERTAFFVANYPYMWNPELARRLSAMDGEPISLRAVEHRGKTLKIHKSTGLMNARRVPGTQEKAPPRPVAPKVVRLVPRRPTVVPRAFPVSMVTSTHGCRFPLWANGEHPTHKYCDAVILTTESWCADCKKIVFNRTPFWIAA